MSAPLTSPRRAPAPWLRLLALFALGLCVGIFFHYLLFRLGLPLQPFIYAAF